MMKTRLVSFLIFCIGCSVSAASPFQRIQPIGGSIQKRPISSLTTSSKKLSSPAFLDKSLTLRSGASGDSHSVHFAKIGVNVILETATMLGVLVGTKKLAERVQIFPPVAGLPLIQWMGIFLIIFASSFLGSIVEGGLSVASNQVLDPNKIPGDSAWYSKLKKPIWNPPGWLFPIMWLIVSKPTQMIAVSKILKKATSVATDVDTAAELPIPVLLVYCAHLSMGDAWNKVFFGLQCIGRGAAVITTFFSLLLASAFAFYQVDPSAGLFLLPTCGWVLVATALNWSIYLKNK